MKFFFDKVIPNFEKYCPFDIMKTKKLWENKILNAEEKYTLISLGLWLDIS